ncbi:MAG TPA: hypothetical protein VED86_04425 [archaeon]|nr:hypothetical protein [archaeon]
MTRCLIYVGAHDDTAGWYEAQLTLPSDPSSVVRAFKTLCFPQNKKGEVTEEDFELLELHGHIGKGRLQLAEDFFSHKPHSD